MKPEGVMLSEVKSEEERQIPDGFTNVEHRKIKSKIKPNQQQILEVSMWN